MGAHYSRATPRAPHRFLRRRPAAAAGRGSSIVVYYPNGRVLGQIGRCRKVGVSIRWKKRWRARMCEPRTTSKGFGGLGKCFLCELPAAEEAAGSQPLRGLRTSEIFTPGYFGRRDHRERSPGIPGREKAVQTAPKTQKSAQGRALPAPGRACQREVGGHSGGSATSENAARAFRAAKKRFRPRQRLRSQRKVGRFQRRVARASARSAGIPAGTWSMTLGP